MKAACHGQLTHGRNCKAIAHKGSGFPLLPLAVFSSHVT